jgi:ABC-type transport system involved in multi-copper enzyme maturation permease subunit
MRMKELLFKDLHKNRSALSPGITLLWKDMRVNRWVLGFGIFILIMPYLIFLGCGLWDGWSYWWHFEQLSPFANISIMLSLLIVPLLLGGNAFAGERADRSAEFLAYLPPSRRAIVASKVVFTFSVTLILVLIHLVVIHFMALSELLPGSPGVVDGLLFPQLPFRIEILMFGVAWLCSTFARSPAQAILCSALVSMLIPTVIISIFRVLHMPTAAFDQVFNPFCVVVGVTSFVAGTIYYIRRSAP